MKVLALHRRNPDGLLLFNWLHWSHFLNDGAANALPGILPYIVIRSHLPISLAGSFMTALLVAQGLQPLSGWLADKIGGRTLVLGGVVLSTVSVALLGFAHPIWLILALLLFTGIGNTAFHPQAMSITRGLVGRKTGLGMSVFMVAGEIGRSLGPLAAGLIVRHLGISWLWLIALPLGVTYPWILRTVPAQPSKKRTSVEIKWREHSKPVAALLAYT